MITAKELEKELRKIKQEEGLFGGGIRVNYLKMPMHHIAGRMNPSDYQIGIDIDPEWEPVYDNRTRRWAGRYHVRDPFMKSAGDVARHESGHWELCPTTVENHAEITDAVIRGLRRHGKEENAHDVANMYEDFVVNTRKKAQGRDMAGQMIFWDDNFRGDESYDPVYEAFVKSHIMINYRDGNRLLGKYFKNEEKVNGVVKNIVEKLGLGRRRVGALMDEDDWPRQAEIFADEIAPLIGENTSFSFLMPNPFDKLMKQPINKQKIALGRYKSGRGPPEHMDRFESLDSLYSALAQRIPIKVKAEGRLSLPAVGYNWRPFDKEQDDLRSANIFRITVGERAEPVPSVARNYFGLDVPFETSLRTFPDFTTSIFDCSGSMKEGLPDASDIGSTVYIPWGDKSKYHGALLTWYGAIKDLERKGILPYINVSIAGFSNDTVTASDRGRRLDKIKGVLFSPQFGGTELNIDKLSKIISRKQSVLMSMSDAQIDNWGDIKDDYRRLIEPHIYFHIQLGSPVEASTDMEKWGKPVFHVNNMKDMEGLARGLILDAYTAYIQKASKSVKLPEVSRW